MGQLGFFDADKRLQALSARGDPLEAIDHLVPWESFRAEIEAVVLTPDELKKSSAGRKPFDAILMFRMLVLQALNNLSDEQVEYQVRDRLSFSRFLGLAQQPAKVRQKDRDARWTRVVDRRLLDLRRKKYGDRKAIVDDPNWQGPSFQTCANSASVCRASETSRRREVLSFGHHAEVAALDVKEADRLLDWAQATSPTTGKPKSTKDLRREVRQSRARLRMASSSPTVQAEPETRNLNKVEQPRSQKLISEEASIAELEAARDQQPSAQPSAASGIRTATVKQLIDALVVRATGKADFEDRAYCVRDYGTAKRVESAHTPANLRSTRRQRRGCLLISSVTARLPSQRSRNVQGHHDLDASLRRLRELWAKVGDGIRR